MAKPKDIQPYSLQKMRDTCDEILIVNSVSVQEFSEGHPGHWHIAVLHFAQLHVDRFLRLGQSLQVVVTPSLESRRPLSPVPEDDRDRGINIASEELHRGRETVQFGDGEAIGCRAQRL